MMILVKNGGEAMLLDENHLILNVNQKFEETFSYKIEEIKGEDLDQILKTENGSNINMELTARVLNGESIEAEGEHFDPELAVKFIKLLEEEEI